MTSENWEQQQQAKVAFAILNGGDPVGAREFRVVVAASQRLENEFYEKLKQLGEIK